MKYLFLSAVFILLYVYGRSQTPVIAGVVPPGFHLDTPSVTTIQVSSCNAPTDSMLLNFDQADSTNDIVFKVAPFCSSFQRSAAMYQCYNSDYSLANSICTSSQSPHMYAVYNGQYFSNLPSLSGYYMSGEVTTSGTFLFNCQQYMGWCGGESIIPIRKQVSNEFFYGWMNVAACPSGSVQLSYSVYSFTTFPKITVLHDTISCQNSYTFCDGFTLNNILQDTAYDAVFTTANPNCDSLVRTRLHVLPLIPGFSSINDTICGNNSYIFPDGDSLYFPAGTTAYTHVDTCVLLSQSGCDSFIIFTYLYVHHMAYGSYQTVQICENSNFTFPDGLTLNNIIQDTFHVSHFVSLFGCDSFNISTHLIVIHPGNGGYHWSHVCPNSSYIFPDSSYMNNINQDTLQTSHVIGANGCDSVILTQISVVHIDTTLTFNGSTLTSNNFYPSTYQWIDCSSNTLIPGATGQTFSIPAPGHYAVIVNLYGCIDTSVCFFATGTHDVGSSGEIYFTNPVTDKIQFSGSNDKEKVLMNSVGQILITTRDTIIPVGDLPQGIYFLHIGEKVWKVLKN